MPTLLRNQVFVRLFSAQVLALLGTGLLTVALGLLAYDLAPGSASAVVGTALTIKIAAYVTLSPLLGALASRVPRRALLVGCDVVRALVALSLPLVEHVWQVYVLILLLQSASAAFTPAFQAVVPTVVPDEADYTRALSWSRLAYDLESLVSPVVAAALLGVVGFRTLFVGTALGFVASAALVGARSLPASPAPATAGSFARRTTAGLRQLVAARPLRALLLMELAVAAGTATVLVNTVVVVRDVLGAGDRSVGVLFAAYGAGSVVVALTIPRLLSRIGERPLMLSGAWATAVALAIGTTVLAAAGETWSWLLVLWCVLGAADAAVLTPSARLLRRHGDERTRPALFAAHFSLSHACYLLTYPVAGVVASATGLSAATAALTALAAVAAIAATVVSRPPRRSARSPEPQGASH